MVHYVLLSFEDDEQAKTFVEDCLRYANDPILTPAQENDVRAEVCGVWRTPTQFCDPSDGHRGSGKFAFSFTRGQKYGWWVCAKCGKPSQAKISATEWEPALGTNLLPAELVPEPFKMRLRGWRSPIEWTWLLEKLDVPKRKRVTKTGVYEYVSEELEDIVQPENVSSHA